MGGGHFTSTQLGEEPIGLLRRRGRHAQPPAHTEQVGVADLMVAAAAGSRHRVGSGHNALAQTSTAQELAGDNDGFHQVV